MKKKTYLHKIERLIWSLRHKECNFEEFIFVDETMIRIFEKPRQHLRIPTSFPKSLPSTSKFDCKLNIWGGISCNGPTQFSINSLL
ncbi:hypothetical protein BpHYR1_040045 [Brachionus plicatilis]|uniref:Uncharacterized protein n=1 Tax=Brachionus plicatilis TaxID=10195 RepID=A0A3M7QLC6_BRAPC|nr:hypothetical protein BpHYR1_040045 [Brachionus plicatilis]